MVYILPGTKIIQEFATQSPNVNKPSLPACIMGPCYQVVRKEEVLTEIPYTELEDTTEASLTALSNNEYSLPSATTFTVGYRSLDVFWRLNTSTRMRRVGFDLSGAGDDIATVPALTDSPLFREMVKGTVSKRFSILSSRPLLTNLNAIAYADNKLWDTRLATTPDLYYVWYKHTLRAAAIAGATSIEIPEAYLFETQQAADPDVLFIIDPGTDTQEFVKVTASAWGTGLDGHTVTVAAHNAVTGLTHDHTADSVVYYVGQIADYSALTTVTTTGASQAVSSQGGRYVTITCDVGNGATLALSVGDMVQIHTGDASVYAGWFRVSAVAGDTFDIYVTNTTYNPASPVTEAAITVDKYGSFGQSGTADIGAVWAEVDLTGYFPAVTADKGLSTDRIRFNFPVGSDVGDAEYVKVIVRGWPVTIPYPNPQNYILPVVDQTSVEFYLKDAWVQVVDVDTGAENIETTTLGAAITLNDPTATVNDASLVLAGGDTFQIGDEIYLVRTVSGTTVTLDTIQHPNGFEKAYADASVVFNLPYKSGLRAGLRELIDLSTNFTTQGVVPGDKVVVDNNGGTYLVQEVDPDNSNRLILTSEIYHTVDKYVDYDQFGYKIHRYSAEFKLPQGFTEGQDYIAQADDVLVVAIEDSDGNPAVSGKLSISYRAFRTDAPARREYESTADILTAMEIDVWNPLGLGVYIASQNTLTAVTGVALTEDTELGYTAATELEEEQNDYAFVPLTQNTTVNGVVYRHVEQMSLPENSKFRIAFLNTALQTTAAVVNNFQGQVTLAPAEVVMGKYSFTLSDTEGDFFVNAVRPGQEITFTRAILEQVTKDNSAAIVSGPTPYTFNGRFLIKKVVSPTELEFGLFQPESAEEVVPVFDDVVGETTTLQLDVSVNNIDATHALINYTIDRTLDKTEQAETIGAISGSYKHRRVYMVWPDTVQISFNNEVTEQPGYYLGCALAGMVAGLPPQQGFTNLGIAGIEGIIHGTEYFTRTQLNKMAEKGTFIVVQDVPGALPYSRHQLSTDPSTIEAAELSITKDIDYFSFWVRDSIDPHIGIRNIFDDTLKLVENICERVIMDAKAEKVERAGPVLTSGNLVSVRANLNGKNTDLPPDRVEVILNAKAPYPMNDVEVHIVV